MVGEGLPLPPESNPTGSCKRFPAPDPKEPIALETGLARIAHTPAQPRRLTSFQSHSQVFLDGHGSRCANHGILEDTTNKPSTSMFRLNRNILPINPNSPLIHVMRAGDDIEQWILPHCFNDGDEMPGSHANQHYLEQSYHAVPPLNTLRSWDTVTRFLPSRASRRCSPASPERPISPVLR